MIAQLGWLGLTGIVDTNPRKRKLTPKQEAEVADFMREGATWAEIGAIFDVSSAVISRIRKEHGLSSAPKGRRRRGPAVTLGTPEIPPPPPPSSKRRSRPGARVEEESAGYLTPEELSDIVELYEAGVEIPELAREYDASEGALRDLLEPEEYVEPPPPPPSPVLPFPERLRRPRGKKLSPEEKLEIINLYHCGLFGGREVADQVGTSPKSVFDVLKEYCLPVRAPGGGGLRSGEIRYAAHAIRGKDVQRAAAMYRRGNSLVDIGGQFGVAPTTVLSTFKLYGFEVKPQGIKHDDPEYRVMLTGLEPEIVEKAFGGATVEELASEYRVAAWRIRDAIDRQNVSLESPLMPNPAGLGVKVAFVGLAVGAALWLLLPRS